MTQTPATSAVPVPPRSRLKRIGYRLWRIYRGAALVVGLVVLTAGLSVALYLSAMSARERVIVAADLLQTGMQVQQVGPLRRYLLQQGDSLKGIAARELGDVRRWEEIYQLNHSLYEAMPEGQSPPVGTRLLLPPR